MTSTALPRAAALAAFVAAGMTMGGPAGATASDPHLPGALLLAQATTQTQPGSAAEQDQGAQPGWPGMMMPRGWAGQGMMQPGMMGQGMMGGMMQPGMMGQMPMMHMRGHMMKFMFAIADTDGDGKLSFEEISAVHKRIFDKVDADKDGKVTPEELQTFMSE